MKLQRRLVRVEVNVEQLSRRLISSVRRNFANLQFPYADASARAAPRGHSPGRPARTPRQVIGVGIMLILILHHLNDQDAVGSINLTFWLAYGQSFTQLEVTLSGFMVTLQSDQEQHLRDGDGPKMTRIPAIASMDKKRYSSA